MRGTIRAPRECTYKDFLNCKALSFKGTEGVVVLSQWFEKMESVFHISNCAVENQVKFLEHPSVISQTQILCKLSKKSRKPAEDNQVLEAQEKELVGYQRFRMSSQSSQLPHMKDLGLENESKHFNDSQLNFDDKEKKDKDGDVDDEGDDHISDIQDTNDEDAETESDEDDIYKYKICVIKNEDEEKLNADIKDSGKGDAEIFDVAKADAEKIEEIKDDAKKAELPPTSSRLFVSSGIGDQFLKLPSDISLVSTIKDTTDVEINSLLDFKIQYEVPHIQSLSVLTVPVSMISEPFVLTPIPITPSVGSFKSCKMGKRMCQAK
ncbi:hypothetical protein Tco_0513612 [Tanacetum coccineum]